MYVQHGFSQTEAVILSLLLLLMTTECFNKGNQASKMSIFTLDIRKIFN